MTLILNGTDNSATTPAVTGTDTDTGVYYPSAGALAIATNGTLRLQVNSGGDTCFNNSSFSTSVNCLSINSGRMFINKSDDWAIEMSGANATRIRLYSSAGGQTTTVGSIQVNTTSALYNAGDVQLNSNGVTFPATQSASGNANTLDDYEEGTWTPSWSGGLTGVTYGSVRDGYYRKIGSVVHIWFGIMTNGLTVTASGLSLTGLPFTAASGSGSNGTVNVWNVTRWTSSPPIVGQVELSSTLILFYNSIGATGAGTDPILVTTGNMDTGSGNRNLVFASATYSV